MFRRFARLFRSATPAHTRPPSQLRPGSRKGRLGLEPLEAREVPSAVSLAFSPDGSRYDVFAVSSTGVLSHFGAAGFTPLLAGVNSVSVAYDPFGSEEIDVVMQDGSVVAYGSPVGGVQTVLPAGFGITSVSVAFAPDGSRVREFVLQDGTMYEQNSFGNFRLLTTGVVSASVAFDPFGSEVVDLVATDGTVSRYNLSGGYTPPPSISGGVDAGSVAFLPNGTLVQAALSFGGSTQGDAVSVAIGSSAPFYLGAVD